MADENWIDRTLLQVARLPVIGQWADRTLERRGFYADAEFESAYGPDAQRKNAMEREIVVTSAQRAAWERRHARDEQQAPADTIRLYRVGALPAEASRLDTSDRYGWLNQYAASTGVNSAAGRWFSSDQVAAEMNRFEHPTSVMRHVDMAQAAANGWRAASNRSLLRYTDAPMTDYFLPADVANKAVVTGVERAPVPAIQLYDPHRDPNYVEEKRFFDKHYKPVGITPPEDRPQRSLGLER